MKQFFTLLLILAISVQFANSQANWKDSTIAKYKIIDAYELDNMVYFKTKKGWGAYWPVQQFVALEPGYQFVLAMNDGSTNNFYVVKKNKIYLVDNAGKPLIARTYDQIGEGFQFSEKFSIENNNISFYYGDTLIQSNPYTQLSPFNEFSITLKNSMVLVNIFEKAMEPIPYQVEGLDGLRDSLDVNGNTVIQYFAPTCSSGIFDLKTGVWILPTSAAKVGVCGNNILVKNVELRNNVLNETISVYDKGFQKTGSFPLADVITKTDAVKIILSDFIPIKVEKSFPDGYLNQLYKFDNGTKQGLFNPYTFNVLIQPDKYEFIFAPNVFDKTVFTVKNNKVGFVDYSTKKTEYSNLYEKLSKTNVFVNYAEQWYDLMECNGNASEPLNQKDTGQVNANFLSQLIGFKNNASLEIDGQFIIAHDFKARVNHYNEPIIIYDAYGEPRDSIRYEENGEANVVYRAADPSASYSGVYNTATRSWIIPRKYSKIIKTANGFSCIRNQNDSITGSCYSLDGKIIFNALEVNSILNNIDYVNKFTGFNFSAGMQHKVVPYNYIVDGLQVILNEQKKSGVFDFYNLKWIIKPENDFIDNNFLLLTYNVVLNNKLGLMDCYGNTIVEPLFKKIEYKYNDGGYILDDSLFCYADSHYKIIAIDTARFLSPAAQNRDVNPSDVLLKAEILNKQLYVQETTVKSDYMEYGDGMWNSRNMCLTRSFDLQTFKQTNYLGALKIILWKNGHILYDTLNNWSFVNNKVERTIISDSYNIYFNKEYIYTSSSNYHFLHDLGGAIVQGDADREMWEAEGYTAIGLMSTYFDGEKTLEIPKDFFLLAVNKNRLGIGYTVLMNSSKSFEKKYIYYDFNTKKMIPCEFEFAKFNYLEIVPVNGYFVFMETDLSKSASNVWLVEEDLKTIKSSFTDLKTYSYQQVSKPVNKIILYSISTKSNKEMYFDKDFQFILEADAGVYEIGYPFWNRLVLKSPQKTIQMNLNGQFVNK